MIKNTLKNSQLMSKADSENPLNTTPNLLNKTHPESGRTASKKMI
jgi:hypothetical protein